MKEGTPIRRRAFGERHGYAQLSKVRHSYLECPSPNNSTIQSLVSPVGADDYR